MPKKAWRAGPYRGATTDQGDVYRWRRAGLWPSSPAHGARSRVLRVVVAGKRRDMGLGGFP